MLTLILKFIAFYLFFMLVMSLLRSWRIYRQLFKVKNSSFYTKRHNANDRMQKDASSDSSNSKNTFDADFRVINKKDVSD